MDRNLLFALDIGTRSVVGLIGEQTAGGIKILALERQEHHTRAMLDGQIHDVLEVAHVLGDVKNRLEEQVGPLKKVSVAAAGRALCTVMATAEIDCSSRGTLTNDDERALELAAIQAAQHQLATGSEVADPTSYYCVGYSVVRFALDGGTIKSLIGQRGKTASIEIIATFLPRQVIDSLQSAIHEVGLEMATLTLEPIAAINVLIPPTMRHLNLALVDVGAGTSDVAITREGSVIGYGMVPFAGDEITEAISHKYLLDFKVAEKLKRELGGKGKKVAFTDILGTTHKLPPKEIVASVVPSVEELAKAIAAQIITLNTTPPQAVLLVGGGSLTPCLPESLAKALTIEPSRVAIRRPDMVEGLLDIPAEICAPDGVTPLGILNLAGGRTLNFVHITLNDQPFRLFNLGKLTVADALLVAGIDVRTLTGRPGLGITVTINGERQFIPGSMGQSGHIEVNGKDATFNDQIREGDTITVKKGTDGKTPRPSLKEVVSIPEPLTVMVNDDLLTIDPIMTVNGKPAQSDTKLADRDEVVCRLPAALGEILASTKIAAEPVEYNYVVNGVERTFRRWPEYRINGEKAGLSSTVGGDDIISVTPVKEPTLANLLGLEQSADDHYTIIFNGTKCLIPLRRYTFTAGGKHANADDIVKPGSVIEFTCQDVQPIVSDVLLAAEFDSRSLPTAGRLEILLNEKPAEYTTVIKNNDTLTIRVVGS
jgi:cell division protein FtsA